MKQQKQAPSTMKVEIGGVEYTYELKEECRFEVGDIVCCNDAETNNQIIRLVVEKVGSDGMLFGSTYELEIPNVQCIKSIFNKREFTLVDSEGHVKATEGQENLFKYVCLENNVWFDTRCNEWIDLKDGDIYIINGSIVIFKHTSLGKLYDYVFINKTAKFIAECAIENYENHEFLQFKHIKNISKATPDEKLFILEKLKEKGKQWNFEKRCIEDLKWVPEAGEEYWYIDSSCIAIQKKNTLSDNDMIRISIGNCFKSKEVTKKASEYMQKCWWNFKNN